MNFMKKSLVLVIVLALSLGMLAGCAASTTAGSTTTAATTTAATIASAATTAAPTTTSSKPITIGVVQLVEHPALDASYKGFVAALKDAGYENGKNIKIVYQTGGGEQATCQTIAQKFLNDKVDMVLAIATPAAQAAANIIKDIPILITAVTDPADAKLVNTNAAPGGNVTGTSDLTPVKEQFDLLKQLLPSVKKVAILYSSSESNSVFQAKLAKQAAAALGIATIESTISASNEIQQVVNSVIGKCDAIYIPTDNAFANAMGTVATITEPAKIPVIVGEANMVTSGGLATVGIDYYKLGYQTGQMAVRILKDNAKPAEMPIEYLKDVTISINTTQAAAIGVTIPADLAAKNTFKP
jgi:putative ABC transport system substrate-binding protein